MEIRKYVKRVYAEQGAARRVGSVRHIDAAVTLRGVQTVRTGETMGLARVIRDEGLRARDGNPLMTLETSSMVLGGVGIAFDRFDVWAHGMVLTHLDAPNHVILDEVDPVTGDAADSDAAWLHWCERGFVTRAVFFDVPAHRGTSHVTADQPVTAAELADMETALGFDIEAGDALLIYSGREKVESDWTGSGPAPVRSALAQDTTQWIAERNVSLLCWDLLDSPPTENFGAHLLIWAQGLAIVDNCDFAEAAGAFRRENRKTAMIAVAPVPVEGTTGCLINPILTF
jgi:kynurenine formamidase